MGNPFSKALVILKNIENSTVGEWLLYVIDDKTVYEIALF